MPLPVDEREFLEKVSPPEPAMVRAAADKFLAQSGMSVTDLAEALRGEYGRCGRSTLLFWFRGEYAVLGKNGGSFSSRWLDARVWDYIQRHWPQRPKLDAPADVLKTRAFNHVRHAFNEAFDSGINALVCGPPSSEKSELLLYLVGARQSEGRDDAVYIKCDVTLSSPLAFLRRLCREFGVHVARTVVHDDYLLALADDFRGRPHLPVGIIDEAQHLDVRCLEVLRGLHDHTRRRKDGHHGFGFILAGSHRLAAQFEHPRTRFHLEQLSSRIPTRIQLTGMTRDEVLTLAARAFGGDGRVARLSEVQQRTLLDDCTATDPYTVVCARCGEPWKPRAESCGALVEKKVCASVKRAPLVYFSPRRLLEFIRQQRRASVTRVATRALEEDL